MIYVVSGPIESGKSSFLNEWIKNRDDIGGILCLKDENLTRHIHDIKTKELFRIEASKSEPLTISVGRFQFLKSAFKKANRIIQKAVDEQNTGYIIIDELGKLELHNKGLHTSATLAITKTKENDKLHSILVIRSSLLKAVLKHYEISSYLTLE